MRKFEEEVDCSRVVFLCSTNYLDVQTLNDSLFIALIRAFFFENQVNLLRIFMTWGTA